MFSLNSKNKIIKTDLGRELGNLISPKGELRSLEIGFKVESKYEIWKRNIRKKINSWINEMKVSGFYTDFWMWNFSFLNLLAVFILLTLILKFYGQLPNQIGLNLDDDWSYDTLVSKNFLFLIPLMHIIAILVAMVLSIKSQKRLSHIFTASYFQVFVLIFFEMLAIRNLIVYFI